LKVMAVPMMSSGELLGSGWRHFGRWKRDRQSRLTTHSRAQQKSPLAGAS
jgi:hypothetical protein